jgi:hypothetical protein
MDRELDPEERQYKEVYEAVSHDVLSKRDPAATMRDLMQEGYSEREAAEWIEAVRHQVLRQGTTRSIAGILAGIFILVSGVALWLVNVNPISFLLMMFGAMLTMVALVVWARYTI